jgi:hypothetical protein
MAAEVKAAVAPGGSAAALMLQITSGLFTTTPTNLTIGELRLLREPHPIKVYKARRVRRSVQGLACLLATSSRAFLPSCCTLDSSFLTTAWARPYQCRASDGTSIYCFILPRRLSRSPHHIALCHMTALGQLRKPEYKTKREVFWRLHTLRRGQTTG